MANYNPSLRLEAAELLRTAAQLLEDNPDGERDTSAAWRLADAGLILREKIERRQLVDVQGFDTPTGRGALLPVKAAGR